MSVPVSVCLICKAALGDEAAFSRLVSVMKINMKHGAWTQVPCKCKPPCERPTEQQMEALNDRVVKVCKNG